MKETMCSRWWLLAHSSVPKMNKQRERRGEDRAKKKIVVHEHDKQAAVADVSENNMQIYSMMCKYNLMLNKMCSES